MQTSTGLNQGNYTALHILKDGVLTDILDLIGSGNGVLTDNLIESVTTPLQLNNKILNVNLSNYNTVSENTIILNAKVNNSQVLTDIPENSIFTDTIFIEDANKDINYITNLQTTLDAKQNISDKLILQLDGVAQAGVNILNFLQNNAIVVNDVLTVSRLNYYDMIPLIYSDAASIKNLTQGVNGELLWNDLEIQLKQAAFQQISTVLPLSITGSNSIVIESLWKPSSLTLGSGLSRVYSDSLGTVFLV